VKKIGFGAICDGKFDHFLNCVANYVQHFLVTLMPKSRHSKMMIEDFLFFYRSYSLACLLLLIMRGGKNEKEEISFLFIALACLSLRRVRNGSRYGGRYTESRESRKKSSFRIGRDF